MLYKVGIVIVSYNASTAVRATLASLRQAKNKTFSEILLIDNASQKIEREGIHNAFERHVAEAKLLWQYIQMEENLGFAGGNNVGINKFMEDDSISHICLLNSDVIVTDFWLDRLIEKQCHIISAVTNKADSEQCVPVDYNLDLASCLDTVNESIVPRAYYRINTYSQNWYRAWRGNLVHADITFFCILLTKELVRKVGLLDTNFFPGGYEDNDYCLRANAEGFETFLARDVFIHHWGSASFGQLQRESFNESALKNRNYLEDKHNIIFKIRPQMPLVSYAQDIVYALKGKGNHALQRYYHKIYVKTLTRLLALYEKEFVNIRNILLHCGQPVPEHLQQELAGIAAYGSFTQEWQNVLKEIDKGMRSFPCDLPFVEVVKQKLAKLAETVYATATCNLAMHAFQSGLPDAAHAGKLVPVRTKLRKILWLLLKGPAFLWKLRGIVFFGGYPYPQREKDGYFQRINAVDTLFSDKWRVYIDHNNLPGRDTWYDRPAPNTLVLRVTGSKKHQRTMQVFSILIALRCRVIYYHSVLRMQDSKFGHLMRLPFITKVIDIHGVVPEEFRYHNDFYSALLYDQHEKLAVSKADYIIVVSEAMHRYLQQKYRETLRGQVIMLPIFPSINPDNRHKPYKNGKPVVVYAGGLHKWQQVPKMIDAITRTANRCFHRFYCLEPDTVLAMLPEELRHAPNIVVDSKPQSELLRIYPECHYGFILREDVVVNHVASPTKLVEYIAMGIVPIVDSDHIGDFNAFGMQFVNLRDFVSGNLPDEGIRNNMAENNFAIYNRLQDLQHAGSATLRHALAFEKQPIKNKIKQAVARYKQLANHYFPKHALRGRIARKIWWYMKYYERAIDLSPSMKVTTQNATSTAHTRAIAPSLPPCDVLVQVDNFLTGGLENVVIDLNETLMQEGLRVGLIVLGEAGESVERARNKGMAVSVTRFDPQMYHALLRTVSPRLVMSHYSIQGATICSLCNIPLIQVLHNTYMWFTKEQKQKFAEAVQHTMMFIAVSEFVKIYSVVRLGVPQEKCLVIPNGIDTSRFDSLDFTAERKNLRAKYGLSDNDFVFLSVGSINHQKNHLGAIKAFHVALPDCPQAKLIILGVLYENQLLAELKKYITLHHLEEDIIYAGASANPYAYYVMADAFLHAAFFEGGQLSLLEAVASNLPIVTTETGFAMHFKGHKGCAIVPPPIDILTYYSHLWELQSTPECERNLAVQIRKTYVERTRPNLPYVLLKMLDKKYSYRLYAFLLNQQIEKGRISTDMPLASWPNSLAKC